MAHHRHAVYLTVCLPIVLKRLLFALTLAVAVLLTGCDDEAAPSEATGQGRIQASPPAQAQAAPAPAALRTPVAPGMVHTPSTGSFYITENNVTVDTSNISSGYVMVRYTGNAARVVIQIIGGGSDTTYRYDLNVNGNWEVFPLSEGNGLYTITVLEHVEGQMFALAMATSFNVTLSDHRLPFLYPNQFVNFNQNSRAVALAAELAQGAATELDVVRNIYEFVINNIVYDMDFAEAVVGGTVTTHVPDVDATLASGRGICFDYASLMAAMLRAQHIPARLDIGYVSGGLFHAWISVYTHETGWIRAIEFSGGDWELMDPTFSAADPTGTAAAFVGGGAGHQPIFAH